MSTPPMVRKTVDNNVNRLRFGATRKLVLRLVALLFLSYAGICAWIYFHQHATLYYPQFTRTDARSTDFSITHDGIVLRGWAIHPGMPNPILYFGGNGESIERNLSNFDQWFPDRSVYLLAYRGYGASDGTPSEAAIFADALNEYDQVQAQHPNQPISVIGRSLGSGVASYLASQRPVAKLVLVTPFDSITAVAESMYPWLPVRWLTKDRYASTSYIANYTNPVLILRAGNDEVIPAADTDRLISAFPHPPVVVNIPDRGHNDIYEASQYGQAMSDFLH